MNNRTPQRRLPRQLGLAGLLTLAVIVALAGLSLALTGAVSPGSALAAPLAAITGTATEFPTATRTATTVPPTAISTLIPTFVASTATTVPPTATPPPPGVPEPSTWLLLTTGLGGVVGYVRMRRRK